MNFEQQKIEDLAKSIGFYGLVGLVRLILNIHYPLDVFDGSSQDKGPRFTVKLHEALAVLDEESEV